MSMYNTHEATHRHDKVYGLLGMATDDVSEAGPLPDYSVPWDELLRRVVTFVLGEGARVKTWECEEKVEITGNGWIVGCVSDSSRNTDGSHAITVQFNLSSHGRVGFDHYSAPWLLRAATNKVYKDDIIYCLEGASHPMII